MFFLVYRGSVFCFLLDLQAQSLAAMLRCLDADGKGLLQLHEVNFLDDWDLGQAGPGRLLVRRI